MNLPSHSYFAYGIYIFNCYIPLYYL
ncbi:hypothetical protein FDC50_05055 [Clostridium botulinum]|nr:hypothetical protein [Clostridium botulinum]NFL07885.1 hypothetical protein [Clostridium botulinum]NFP07045.1 hypothetical protein [Clostridium botulinum]NFP13681.1 hypothetical protein [Clostridium botulinum]NFT08367.1 hypothetical protein [Clostridium botulinum]